MRKIYISLFCLVAMALVAVKAQYVEPIRNLNIPFAAINVDGDPGDEGYSEWQSCQIAKEAGAGITPYLDDQGDDFTARFKVAWNYQYLFLYVDVIDDIEESMTAQTGSPWTWDNFEIFVDIDTNSTQNGYTAGSTRQMRVNRGDSALTDPGQAAQALWLVEQNNNSADWSFEVGMPWQAVMGAAVTAEEVTAKLDAKKNVDVIGFDMGIADADGDGTGADGGRNSAGGAQAFWDTDEVLGTGNEDNAYQNRRVFGLVTLMGGSAIINHSTSVYGIYPNPSNGKVNFTNLNGNTVNIYNLAGVRIKSVKAIGNNASVELTAGVYIVDINGDKQKLVVE